LTDLGYQIKIWDVIYSIDTEFNSSIKLS